MSPDREDIETDLTARFRRRRMYYLSGADRKRQRERKGGGGEGEGEKRVCECQTILGARR